MRIKFNGFIITMMMAVILSGCGNNDSKVNQVIQTQMQEADNKNNQTESTNETKEDMVSKPTEETKKDTLSETIEETGEDTLSVITGNSKKEATTDNAEGSIINVQIDVDLTKLSSTMVYSEVYNMMYTPEDYIGKTVKMSGMYVAYTNQDETKYYPAVIIADATACCAQGLEFVLEGNPPYPERYPEMETEITVVGTFETYDEDGNMYCRLQNANIE